MTVMLCTYADVLALDDAQRLAEFDGGPDGEIDDKADEALLDRLGDAAHKAVFGVTIGHLLVHERVFVQRIVAPATVEEALALAGRADFDLMRGPTILLDWYNYGILILASLEGKARTPVEIEKAMEDAMRHKLGLHKDSWLAQNDRPRRRN